MIRVVPESTKAGVGVIVSSMWTSKLQLLQETPMLKKVQRQIHQAHQIIKGVRFIKLKIKYIELYLHINSTSQSFSNIEPQLHIASDSHKYRFIVFHTIIVVQHTSDFVSQSSSFTEYQFHELFRIIALQLHIVQLRRASATLSLSFI